MPHSKHSRPRSEDPAAPAKDCGGADHRIHRRRFLEGLAAGSLASTFSWSGLFANQHFAAEASRQEKSVILLWLCGGPSQFETWDPKDDPLTRGPFGHIPTCIPGVHVSELMPRSAKILDRLAIVRSMRTSQSEHFQGIDLLTRGEEPRPPFTRPTIGATLSKELERLDSPIPSFVLLDPCPEGNEFKSFKAGDWAGWLGAEHAPVRVGGEYRLADVERVEGLSDSDHEARHALRSYFARRYENERRARKASSYNATYDRVRGLMSCADLFDIDRLPEKDRERYGPGTFGLHTLLARHLVENGAPFVMVANGMPWDCHVFNHEVYQMLVPDLDNIVFRLVTDLEDRGLLDSTLVVVMGEFGRTPWINASRGRDHYPDAWSLALAGCGIEGGAVVGETDARGIEVASEPLSQRNLFATIFSALGLDPHHRYDLPGLPAFHRVEGDASPIESILSASSRGRGRA